jgi:hypothetical protein
VGWQSSTRGLNPIWLQVKESTRQNLGFMLCFGNMLELLSKHVGSSFFSIETWCDFGHFFIHRKILCRIHIDFVFVFLFFWVGHQVVKKRYFK